MPKNPPGIDAAPAPASEPPLPRMLAPRGRHHGPLPHRIRLRGSRVAGEQSLPLCRLRFTGLLHTWGFALYLAGTDGYRDDTLPSGLPAGSPEEALDCAGGLYLNALVPAIRVAAGLVVLVGPPASGRTSFVQALIARRQIDAETVVSSDEIRAEFLGTSPAQAESDAADARIFEERDRRIIARLAAGHSAVAESTNVTPQARARLIAIARRFNAPVTMLRFNPDLPELLQRYTERGRTDLTAADVRAYTAVMTRDADPDQLRAEGAITVHDVPRRRQGTTPAEAAARFSFACTGFSRGSPRTVSRSRRGR